MNYIYFKSRDELLRIDASSIAYFEADRNYTSVVLANGFKGMIGSNLAKMEQTLQSSLQEKARCFVRIGKRYIINMKYICHINVLQQYLILSDQRTFSYRLDISKDALKKLKEIIVTSINNKA